MGPLKLRPRGLTLKGAFLPVPDASHRRDGMSRSFITLFVLAAVHLANGPATAEPQHAIAMHGDPKYPAGFTHFPYVDPNAPKGGKLTLGRTGSFDSTNPLIVKGEPVDAVREFVIESLLMRGQDEPFTLYGLLAESLEVADDRSSITFNLNPKAQFSDGTPVTSDDVIFGSSSFRRRI